MISQFHKLIRKVLFFILIFTLSMIGIVDASGEIRIIALLHIHTKEELTILYKKDGKYIPEALKKINWILRDWRRNKAIEIDPKSIDIAWEMHAELGSQMPIHVICGYRSRETNEILRNSGGGQAIKSQHITGKAIDLSFPDIPIRRLRYSAMIRELGGVGYYPTSAIPFVHIDTGTVRSWPRMPHDELALLFPRGHSKHISAEGKVLQSGDYLTARRREPQLAVQLAQFFDLRDQAQRRVKVASTEAPRLIGPAVIQNFSKSVLNETENTRNEKNKKNAIYLNPKSQKGNFPQLVSEPRLIERSSHFSTGPTNGDREKLTAMVSEAAFLNSPQAAPRLVSKPRLVSRPESEEINGGANSKDKNKISNNSLTNRQLLKHEDKNLREKNEWAATPAYDEDHPEELNYQPFPILPLLTSTASPNDPVLSRLIHPNMAKTFEMIDADGNILPLRFRPGIQTASLLFSQKFTGNVVDLSILEAERDEDILLSLGFIKRFVKTSRN